MKTTIAAAFFAPLLICCAHASDVPDYATAEMCAELWHGYSRATHVCQAKEMRYKAALADAWSELSDEVQQVCHARAQDAGGSYRALMDCMAIHSE